MVTVGMSSGDSRLRAVRAKLECLCPRPEKSAGWDRGLVSACLQACHTSADLG